MPKDRIEGDWGDYRPDGLPLVAEMDHRQSPTLAQQAAEDAATAELVRRVKGPAPVDAQTINDAITATAAAATEKIETDNE